MRKVDSVLKFIKDWMLIIAMSAGILAYLVYRWTPALYPYGPAVRHMFSWLQPVLIFLMLFLQFNKVSPKDFRFRGWHLALLLFQGLIFATIGYAISRMPDSTAKLLLEAFACCIICPTATASGVITDKLGGSIPDNMTYLMMINGLVAVLFPLMIPILHPVEGFTFMQGFTSILLKVFPMLIFPALTAWVLRFLLPKVHEWLLQYSWAAFYIWSVSLWICLVMTARTVAINHLSLQAILMVGLVSIIACFLQFWTGHVIGARTGAADRITAGQSLGQKNTALLIWLGYTYLTPATAVAGGLYAIWHNVVNSIELKQAQSAGERRLKRS